VPGSPAKMTGSSRKGALCADLANFVLNEPYVPNAALPAMSDAQAMSQKALAPPLPSAISYPSGREKNEPSPSRMEATRDFTGVCRCEVPRSVLPPRSSASTCSGRILLGPEPNRPSSGFIEDGMFTILSICSTLANDAD